MHLSRWELFLLVTARNHGGQYNGPRDVSEVTQPSDRNAFHIFNAVHSSVRQWGSSLNHNGMSFFPALVPAGTELFHGTSGSKPVEGLEWLAFEPEHAQVFAHGPRGPPRHSPGRGPPPHVRGGQQPVVVPAEGSDLPPRQPPPDGNPGFLHTYLAKKDLQLLYIDGMSAGKTSNGTLDAQDYILLNDSRPHQGMWERERAQGLCNISRDDWGGRVDGFLRMEAGFEIILCHFERDLEVKSIAKATGECKNCDTGDSKERIFGSMTYLRAVADRYHGIGGGRIRINYEKMITAYALDVDLFTSGDRGPRLKDVSSDILRKMRHDVDVMVMSEPNPFTNHGIDWQTVADAIVTRYSTRLQLLAMPEVLHDEPRLNSELNHMLSPFIDYDNRSSTDETARCASHFIPSHETTPSFVADTLSYISQYICHELVSTQHGDVADDLAAKQKIITDLIAQLNWTTWKECKSCAYDEICSIPIWPFGSEEDWITPTCRNATTIKDQSGYWGFNRWRPGPPPGEHNGSRPFW